MSEAISGVTSQFIQQILEKQSFKQQPTEAQNKRTFESYLQQDKTAQTQNDSSKVQTESVDKTQTTTTSGVEMQRKLEEMQSDLSARYKQANQDTNNINKMIPELLDGKSRLTLLKEAYSTMGSTSKATNNVGGRLVQLESDYKQIEDIMRSDKNLSTGELLALQARMYQVSQHIEVMSKVVDQMSGGIKTVLNTNI